MTARSSGKRQIASSSAEDDEEYQLITKHAKKSRPVDTYRSETSTEQYKESTGQTKRAQDKRKSASKGLVDEEEFEEDNSQPSQPRQERDRQPARQKEPLPPRHVQSDNANSRLTKEAQTRQHGQDDSARSRPSKASLPLQPGQNDNASSTAFKEPQTRNTGSKQPQTRNSASKQPHTRNSSDDTRPELAPPRIQRESSLLDAEAVLVPPQEELSTHLSPRDLEELRIQSHHQLEMLRIKNDQDVISLHREMWEQYGKAYVATGAFPRPRTS